MASCDYFKSGDENGDEDTSEEDGDGSFPAAPPGATTGTEHQNIEERVDASTGKKYQRLCSAIQCDTNGDGESEQQIPLVDDELSFGLALNSRHESSPYETTSQESDDETGTLETKHKYLEFIFVADNANEVNFRGNHSPFNDLFSNSVVDNKFFQIIHELVDLNYAIDYTVIEVPANMDNDNFELGKKPINNINIHRIPLPVDDLNPSNIEKTQQEKTQQEKTQQNAMLLFDGDGCTNSSKQVLNCIQKTALIDHASSNIIGSDMFSGWKAAIDQIDNRRDDAQDAKKNQRKFYVIVLLTSDISIQRMGAMSTFETALTNFIETKIDPSNDSEKLTFKDRIKFINIVAHASNEQFGGEQEAIDKRLWIYNRLELFKKDIDKVMGENTVINFYDKELPDPNSPSTVDRALDPKPPTDKEFKELEINSSIFAFISKAFPNLILQCLLDTISIEGNDGTDADGHPESRSYTANVKIKDNLDNADFSKDENVYIWYDALDGAQLLTSVDITTTRCCVDMHSDTERSQYEENGELLHPLEYFSRPNNYPSIDDTNNICYTTSTKEITFNIGEDDN